MTSPKSAAPQKTRPLVLAVVLLLVIAALLVLHAWHSGLIGQWQTTDRAASGVQETTTYRFLPDGLFTCENMASQGTPMSGTLAELLPTVRRVNAKGTYTVKNDVVTLRTTDFNMFDAHQQPVTPPVGLSMSPDPTPAVCRFQVHADTLTLDKLDGTPQTVLTRQHS